MFRPSLGGVVGALLAAGLWEWRGGAAAFLGGAALTAGALLLHLGWIPTRQGGAGTA